MLLLPEDNVDGCFSINGFNLQHVAFNSEELILRLYVGAVSTLLQLYLVIIQETKYQARHFNT